MGQDDYSLSGEVYIRNDSSAFQEIALSLQKQYESGLHQKDILKCQDGELNVNPLILELLFPWLAPRLSHNLTDSPQMIILPDYSLQEVRKLIDTFFWAAHKSDQLLKMVKPGNCDLSSSFDNDNVGFAEDDFSQIDLKHESIGDTGEYVYDCDNGLDLDQPERKKKRTSKRQKNQKQNVNQSPTEDEKTNPRNNSVQQSSKSDITASHISPLSEVTAPNTSERWRNSNRLGRRRQHGRKKRQAIRSLELLFPVELVHGHVHQLQCHAVYHEGFNKRFDQPSESLSSGAV